MNAASLRPPRREPQPEPQSVAAWAVLDEPADHDSDRTRSGDEGGGDRTVVVDVDVVQSADFAALIGQHSPAERPRLGDVVDAANRRRGRQVQDLVAEDVTDVQVNGSCAGPRSSFR